MFINERSTREQLLTALACEPGLAAEFNRRLLARGLYTDEELRQTIFAWCAQQDEDAADRVVYRNRYVTGGVY